jgi:hypothetical protein
MIRVASDPTSYLGVLVYLRAYVMPFANFRKAVATPGWRDTQIPDNPGKKMICIPNKNLSVEFLYFFFTAKQLCAVGRHRGKTNLTALKGLK